MGPKGNCFNRQKVKRRRHFYFWIRGRMSASRRHISGFCCTLEEAQIANLDKSTVCGKFVYSCDHIFVGRYRRTIYQVKLSWGYTLTDGLPAAILEG